MATGETNTLEEFVAEAFNCVGLDWREHVVTDPSLLRPSETMISRANTAKTRQRLGWQARYKMQDVVRMMGQLYVRDLTGIEYTFPEIFPRIAKEYAL